MDNHPIDPMDADGLQALYAKTIYSLRESGKELLRQHGVDNPAALLEKIRRGELAEHPAYEHYLSALIIDRMRMQIREQAAQQLYQSAVSAEPAISMHLMLKDEVEARYAQQLSEPVRLAQDALLLAFDNGLMVEARCFSKDEYSVGWSWGDAELRIDTAPTQSGLASFPPHLHDDGDKVRAVPASCQGNDCRVNFFRLIDMLLINPLLE